MFCPNCGNNVNGAFCGTCGAKMPVQEQTQQPVQQQFQAQYQAPPVQQYAQAAPEMAVPKKKSKLGLIIAIVAAVAIIAVVCLLFLPKLLSGAGSSAEIPEAFVYKTDDGEYRVLYDGILMDDEIDGIRSNYTRNVTGDICYIPYDNDVFVLKDGELYDTIKNINNLNYWDVEYCTSGQGMLWLDDENRLNIYSFADKDSERISDEDVHNYCLSPDGKTALYGIYGDGVYLYTNGETEKIYEGGHAICAVGVTNDGEYSFVYDKNEYSFFCIDREGNDEEIFNINVDMDKMGMINRNVYSFNATNKQVAFFSDTHLFIYDATTDDMTEYELDDGITSAVPLVPHQIMHHDYFKDYASIGGAGAILYTSVADLNDCFYTKPRGTGSLFCIDDDELNMVAELLSGTILSNDGRSVFFRETADNTLYRITLDDTKPIELVEDCAGFGVSKDFNRIFYFTEDEELYTCNADGSDAKLLDEDVCINNYMRGLDRVGYMFPVVLGNDRIIYPDNDGDIFICDIKGNKEEIDAEEYRGYDLNENVCSRLQNSLPYMASNGAQFISRSYVLMNDDDEFYIIDSKGKITDITDSID